MQKPIIKILIISLIIIAIGFAGVLLFNRTKNPYTEGGITISKSQIKNINAGL